MLSRHWVMILVLVGGVAPALGEDSTALIAQLADKDVKKRISASTKLAGMGETVRLVLERVLRPTVQPAQPAGPTEEQKKQIASQIALLSSSRYQVRNKATAALNKLGRIATDQLREAAKSKDLETSSRAKLVLEKLYPKVAGGKVEVQKVEAAMLLAMVGTRKSIPALRHAMQNGGTRLCSEAAAALRAILHGGPTDDSQEWEKDRAKMLEAWRGVLDKQPAAPSGVGATLKLGYGKGTSLQARTTNKFGMRMDMSAMIRQGGGAGPPGMGKTMTVTQAGKALFQVTVKRATPVSLEIRFAEHESVKSQRGVGAGDGRTKKRSWKGKTLMAVAGEGGKLELKMDGKLLPVNRDGPMLQLGLLLALQLPQGEYQPGQSRSLSPTLFSWMNVLLFGSAAGKASLLGHYGKLTYLGRVGGEDRYFMVTQMAASQRVRSIMRLGLHGELRFDAKRGVLTRYQLSGPMNGSFAMGPGGGRMAAEGHWETSFNSVAPQKAGQNQDQEAGRKK